MLCAPDFDPSNPNGKLYLADLGFTKEECDIDGRRILRSVVGTISFMAPELLVLLENAFENFYYEFFFLKIFLKNF